ncbi:hypothetical protein [uncultured Oscillibacter sp.]|uniref:hypothetical protein n=1 Tax=uncultured Oscillibacter sp. TaxID=876091 RepID=UPI0025E9497C|nr:hypothetical protein [uncultured Oscillibacter sp.]
MDRFPILWEGRNAGELTVEGEALYTWFSARCRPPREGLWCVWAVGERGELRLGVLEPAGEQAAIRRRFSQRMTEPLGRLLRGELRPAGESRETPAWTPAAEPERLFRTLWLRRQLHGVQGALTWQTGDGQRRLALPCDTKKPFPLPSLFCFARLGRIQGADYWIFAFDREEWPVFH